MKTKIKNSNVLIFLLFLTVVAIVYRGTINNEEILFQGDGLLNYTAKEFIVNSLASGELPLWNPFTALGTPFLADVQQTVVSPFNIIFLFFDTVIGVNIFHIIQLTCAGFFMYLYINEVFKKRHIGIFIGFIFAFSSMIGGNRIEHTTIITTIIFFPLILFFLERFKSTEKDKYIIFSSIAMAIHFMSGFTQIVIYFDIVFFVYFIYVCKCLNFKLITIMKKLLKWIVPYILLCAIQLIPTLQLMRQSGRDEVSFEFFSVLSYDLRILLMMIFPYAYLDKFLALGEYASSGLDIEIYIGIIPLIYLLYPMIYHFKDKFVRLISGIMIAAFCFGMAPNIPFVNKIVYSIPIIGSFRVSARILSVFLICGLILVGYTFSKLNEKLEVKRLIKFSVFATILIVFNMFTLSSIFSQSVIPTELSGHYAWNGEVFIQVVLICFINLICLCCIYIIKNKKYAQQVILGFLCVVTLLDVGKYSILKYTLSSEQILNDHSPQKVQGLIMNRDLNYRSFALLNSPNQYYDNKVNVAKIQRSLISEVKFYNSYITFIDQKFNNYKISETAYFPNFSNYLNTRNDLISMMSIRYVIDAWNQDFNSSIPTDKIDKQIFSESDISILNNSSQLSVKSYPVELEPNSAYKITLNMSVSEEPQLFYMDFYTDTYDDPKQDGSFNNITSGTYEYVTVIPTGDVVPSKDVIFRIVSQSNTDIQISKVTIDKVKTMDAYKKVVNEEGIVVYENINAKPILYTPTYVKSIDSYDLLYGGKNIDRLDEYSYIQNFSHDIDLSQVNTKITDITQKYNSVSANVTSNRDTFINHSQLSYPGWKVYVDDTQVPIYNVNNLIQGAEVPAGTHQITFVYDPWDFKIGVLLSFFGIVLCCYYLFFDSVRTWYKNKKQITV